MNRKYNTKTDSASLNVDDTPRWYSVHVHSGFELSVVRNIKQAIADAVGDMASNFIDYFPKEDVTEATEATTDIIAPVRANFSGYIFIKMRMRPETWKLVRSVSRVVGFLGNLNPKYLSEEEYQAMIENIKTKVAHVAVAELHVGDMVRIIDGSFQSLSGKVKTLLPDKKKIEIVVKIFDRETTIDIEISKIEKIDTNN